MELFFVVGRLLASSFANVLQKKLAHDGLHPFFIVLVSYCVLCIICLPLLWTFNPFALNKVFWLNISWAALLDMAGSLFLVMSLSKTDLSVFGPLNAYKVVISMFLAMIFLGEIPNNQGFIGIAIIVIASFFLFPASDKPGKFGLLQLLANKGVQYRFLSILLFSIGTLPLKNAVMAGNAIATTVFWCLIGLPLAFIVHRFVVKDKITDSINQCKNHVSRFISLGLLIFSMQYLTMLIFSQFLIAYSLALFQLAMVLHVFLGHHIFKEKHIVRRLIACLIMVSGSLLVLNA